MLKLFYSFLICILPFSIDAQLSCKFLSLRAQNEIDDFPKNYKHCDTFHSIEITQQNGPVFNLDSLARLNELYQLEIFAIDSLHSISGLHQLKKVENFHFVALRKFDPFLSLDTIGSLSYEVGFEDADLTLFQNIKHISTAIRVINDLKLEGMPSYTAKNRFWIDVENNSLENDISNLVPNNINSLQWLWLKDNENLSLSGIEVIDSALYVAFNNNKNCDFSSAKDLKRIMHFQSSQEDIIENHYPSFNYVKELDLLSFHTVQNLIRLDSLFPNLEVIKNSITLRNNSSLADIKILDHFPTNWFTPIPGLIINIMNNPLLEDCLSSFICNVLSAYPNKVVMSGNNTLCNKPELIEACVTHTYEDSNEDLVVFPNPGCQKINIQFEDFRSGSISIFTPENKAIEKHKFLNTRELKLKIDHYPQGVYFLQFNMENGVTINKKFIKIN